MNLVKQRQPSRGDLRPCATTALPRLRHVADWRAVLCVLGAVALPVLGWSAALRHPALLLASALLSFLALIVNHNHQHHATFKGRPWNQLFGIILTWATGQPAKAMVPMHMDNHHDCAGQEDDMVRPTLVSYRWNLLNLLVFPWKAIAGYRRRKADSLRDWREARPVQWRQLVVERCCFYPLLLALLVMRPLETLLFFGVPWIAGQWAIIAINLVQHDGCDPGDDLAGSRNFLGRGMNWLFFNNGFHTAHHVCPGAHWMQLPALHAQLAPGIPKVLEQPSLGLTLLRFYIWPGRRPQLGDLER